MAGDERGTGSASEDDVIGREFLAAFGTRLRLLRVARAISQRELADLSGIHRTVVGRIERGEINFGIDYVWRLAEALGIRSAVLIPEFDDALPEVTTQAPALDPPTVSRRSRSG